jgi:hypothetical protein
VLVLLVVLAAGCGGGTGDDAAPTTTTAPVTFAGAVCAAVSEWTHAMVDTANGFTHASGDLTPEERKARYTATFDDLRALTEELRAAIDGAPDEGAADAAEIRAALDDLIDTVEAEMDGNQAEAAGLPLSSYQERAVNDGHLYTGNEKALSTVLKGMNDQGRAHGVSDLGGSCGRV